MSKHQSDPKGYEEVRQIAEAKLESVKTLVGPEEYEILLQEAMTEIAIDLRIYPENKEEA